MENVKLDQVVNMGLLQAHLDNGLVSKTYHPTLSLWIYNYTHLAQKQLRPRGDDKSFRTDGE
jgi:hypothetical protein